MPACKFALFFCLALLLRAIPSAAEDDGRGLEEAAVNADRLEIDHKLMRARFSGNVRATYGELKISCDEMSVSYDEDGRIAALNAKGKVMVTRGDASARASSARLDAGQDLLILEGNPVLTKGPNQIQGERIEIHLKTGKLEVANAKGKFKIGRQGP